jgi:tail tube protein gp19
MPQSPNSLYRAHTAGHFQLEIDGAVSTAYLKSVDGGFHRGQVLEEQVGPDNLRIKHLATVDIEPFSLEFGISGASDVLKWIQASWRKDFNRRSGQITHANFDLYPTLRHEFSDALITETTFPTLDGSSKEAAYIKIKFQPEFVNPKKVSENNRLQAIDGKQKQWVCNAFRFSIDGLKGVDYTNKIDSFTIKQGVKKLYTGKLRLPQIEPTKIDFPNISGTIALDYADDLINWYQKYVASGQADTLAHKTGMLEFLAPDRKTMLFRINMYDIGIHHLEVVSSQANAETIKRVKYELYVGKMDLDGSGALSLQ